MAIYICFPPVYYICAPKKRLIFFLFFFNKYKYILHWWITNISTKGSLHHRYNMKFFHAKHYLSMIYLIDFLIKPWAAEIASLLTCSVLRDLKKRICYWIPTTICLNLFQFLYFALIALTTLGISLQNNIIEVRPHTKFYHL